MDYEGQATRQSMGESATRGGLARGGRLVALGAILAVFSGFSLVLVPGHDSGLGWLGLGLLVAGLATLASRSWPRQTPEQPEGGTLAAKLIRRVTLRGRLTRFLPGIGGAVITADLGYNAFLSPTPALLTEDVFVLLGGGALLAYPLLPSRFHRERDFVLIFLFALNAVLVVPVVVARLLSGSLETSVDIYSWVALAPETTALLNLLGVSTTVVSVPGASAPGLVFAPLHSATTVTVVVTASCSGMYSFGIFASAFSAYVATEFERLDRKVWALLALGFVSSYVANILRMTVIVLVGYYTDSAQTELQNMLIAHSYAGWIIFLSWVSLFWFLLWHWFPPRDDRPQPRPSASPRKQNVICTICLGELTAAVPAVRCSCGAFYHVRCLGSSRLCPSCGGQATHDSPLTTGHA